MGNSTLVQCFTALDLSGYWGIIANNYKWIKWENSTKFSQKLIYNEISLKELKVIYSWRMIYRGNNENLRLAGSVKLIF